MPRNALAPSTSPFPAVICLLLSLLLYTSCAQTPTPTAPLPPSTPATGESLFLARQFPEALVQFENDHETALAPKDRQHALFGLACSQLALATDDQQVTEAIANLELWSEGQGNDPGLSNPQLLIIAIKIQGERWQKNSQELARLLKQKNGVIASQQKKIAEMADTVDSLHKQLEELEAIDETLQEKRKAL